jgi:hypothetical protein
MPPIGDRLVSQNQSTFIKGKFIMESVVFDQGSIQVVASAGVVV